MGRTVLSQHAPQEEWLPARRYVSRGYVAEYLGVSVNTVDRYVSAGYLTMYRFADKVIRLDLNEVDRKMIPIV